MTSAAGRYLTDLLTQIDGAFAVDDVRTLALGLGIDYENLPGRTRVELIRELLRRLAAEQRLPELLAALREARPRAAWPDLPADAHLFAYDPFGEKSFTRLPYEPETVLIPAGPFLMGSDADDPAEAPRHSVTLTAFAIGLTPVTNEQYARCLWDSGRVAGLALLWDGNTPPAARLNQPVAGVTWYEALAYCRWLSAATGRAYTLPTEAQWEKAARGPDGRLFPWGDAWEPGRCHVAGPDLLAVDAYDPQSVYGVYDLVGNAREWTLTAWGGDPRAPDPAFAYPWRDDRRNNPDEPSTTRRVYRGGRIAGIAGVSPATAAQSRRPGGDPVPAKRGLRCTARGGFLPDKPGPASNRHGLRVVLSLT